MKQNQSAMACFSFTQGCLSVFQQINKSISLTGQGTRVTEAKGVSGTADVLADADSIGGTDLQSDPTSSKVSLPQEHFRGKYVFLCSEKLLYTEISQCIFHSACCSKHNVFQSQMWCTSKVTRLAPAH